MTWKLDAPRYLFGGSPLDVTSQLIPLPKASSVPPCTRCGAPRVFELQLLPSLLNVLQPASPAAAASLGVEDDYIPLGTAAVYSCSASCWAPADGDKGTPVEEHIFVQPEASS